MSAANPYASPQDGPPVPTGWTSLLRILTYVLFPFVVIAILAAGSLLFGLAFQVSFRVHNRTDKPILVTPVARSNASDIRTPLPISNGWIPIIPARKRGDFHIEAGQSMVFTYDMDDYTLSEIVVHSESVSDWRQIEAGSNLQAEIDVVNLARAPAVTAEVRRAAQTAEQPTPRRSYCSESSSDLWWRMESCLCSTAARRFANRL